MSGHSKTLREVRTAQIFVSIRAICVWSPIVNRQSSIPQALLYGQLNPVVARRLQRNVRGQGGILDRNLTILIAEDSEDDAFFLERAFRKIGLKNPIQILTDGAEVLDYLKAEG